MTAARTPLLKGRVAGRARRLASAILLIGAVLSASCARPAPADVRIAQVDGSPVAYRVLGHGRPVIVLISGLGDGMSSSDKVAPQLARDATVIVYDRPGYGASAPARTVRDAAAAERELTAVLNASGVAGPYFILGHSLGGLYAEYFAAKHPGDVAGLILEESRPADYSRRCQAAGFAPCLPPPMLAALMPRAARAELAALADTEAQVSAVRRPSLPVLVLSRPIAAGAGGIDGLWNANQGDLAARYATRRVSAPGGAHYIHKDQAAWFVAQVQAFISAAQPGAASTD